jgi:DNA-directed RNA polymerase II subunit RPB1
MDGGATRGEDDLTYKLAEVIKANQAVRKFESEGAPAHVITEFETLLQVSPKPQFTYAFTTQ